VFAVNEGIRYFADVGDQRNRALFYRAQVSGQPLEEATRLELLCELARYLKPVADHQCPRG
jgi:hypothetical protein